MSLTSVSIHGYILFSARFKLSIDMETDANVMLATVTLLPCYIATLEIHILDKVNNESNDNSSGPYIEYR